ncbi:hypothetical protein LguiA_023987 [Lonicera macranthoides]
MRREGGQENNQYLAEMYHYGLCLVCEVGKKWKNSSEKQLLNRGYFLESKVVRVWCLHVEKVAVIYQVHSVSGCLENWVGKELKNLIGGASPVTRVADVFFD